MPTFIGAVFFCLAIYFFFLKKEALFGLLIVASVFQAASAINFDDRGIQPYYIVAVFLIGRAALNWGAGVKPAGMVPEGGWILLFGGIAIGSAFILPIIFAGTPVYDPKIGIDDGLTIRPPLSFGLNNVAQAGFLFCHIATAFALVYIGFSSAKARRAYLFAFYLVLFIVVAQSVCQLTGIPFPDSLFLNNPGYSLWTLESEVGGTRNPGTFSEPSFAGAFMVMCCAGFLAEYLSGKRRPFHLLGSLLGCALVASSGSILTLFLITLALLLRYFPFRPPWHVNLARARRLAWVSLILGLPVVLGIFASSSFGEALLVNTVSKTDSGSFLNRTAADLYALQLLLQTHGVGVGLGSSRASSLLATLLSNIGVVGVLAFIVFFIRLFKNLPVEYSWLKWAALALIVNMCINVPDVTMPTLWIPTFLAIQIGSERGAARLDGVQARLNLRGGRTPGKLGHSFQA